jgi:hypothetical protein
MRHLIRSTTTGRFIPRNQVNIVAGRLYNYKGTVVRAKKKCANGLRLVSFHKKLNGFARDEELSPISKEQVQEYLKEA